MASLKSLKIKIHSYKKTGTVTKAMQAVSAVKMRKAQERASSANPHEESHGIVPPEAGMHEAELQLAHFRRRLRHGTAESLQRVDDPAVGHGITAGYNGPASDFSEATLNHRCSPWRQRQGSGCDEE